MRLCVLIFLTLMFLGAADAQDNAGKEDLKNLEGTWIRIYMEADGKKSEDGKKEPEKAIKLTISGDKFTPEGGGPGMTFKLDPTKKPKHLDMSVVDAKGKTATFVGIYELRGDVLKLCVPFPFEEKFDKIGKRPTEFRTKPGGSDVLEVYKREKK